VTGEEDDDSFLRAIAAAPPAAPIRALTVIVVRAADSAASVLGVISDRAELVGGEVDARTDGVIAIAWGGARHAERAATFALELRDALPDVAIAIATGAVEPGRPSTAIAEHAIGLLEASASTIRIDEETADRIDRKFSLRLASGSAGGQIVLGSVASDVPAQVGQLIGNYRIVRLLGTGGMGVVFLAEHVTLGRKVVIKFVQERLSQADEYTARFFSEAKIAASIRHPGIVDVFDYGQDERGRGYIVMEFLDGESLRTRLAREKPLAPELAVALTTQIASAVGAAHEAGVIHRDLKPDNVFLVADRESLHRVRAKVLDFGLAKHTAPTEKQLTQTGNFVGTPVYIAPEQARGKTVDARTDIYSLGCILFEMVCGRPPFTDETVGDLIIAHASTPPPSPRSLVPTLAPALERTILRALAKSPGERFPDMAAFVAALAGLATGSDQTALARPVPALPAVRRARSRVPWIAAGIVAVIAAVAIIAVTQRSAAPPRPATLQRTGNRPMVAVIDPRTTAGGAEVAWLSVALGEVVTTGLLGSETLSVVPSVDVARMRADLGITDSETWSREQLAKVRTDLGAAYVVAGSYRVVNDKLDVELALYDTATGRAVGKARASGPPSDPATVGALLIKEITRMLGVPQDDVATPASSVILPKHPAAARYYSEGLARLRRNELAEARALFERAAKDAPNDPLIHGALASTWRELGYERNAASEAKLAYENSGALPKEHSLAIEARYHETTREWDRAIEAYRTLVEFYPTRVDYGLALATAQTSAGDAKGAYATLDNLRKLVPDGQDPRIEIAEAEAAEAADDMQREREHADKAVALARARGARVLLARALFHLGWASWVLGKDAEAKAAYEEARQIYIALGDDSGLARCLNNIGLAAHREGRDEDAQGAFAEALRLATAIGDTTAQAWVLQNWGFMLIDQGNLAHALELAMKKLELGGARGDSPASQAAAHANIAEIARLRGDLATARTHARAADDLLRGVDERLFAAFTADQLGEIARADDDLLAARKHLTQAIRWASAAKHPMITAECRMSLARTELDAGNLVEAEQAARAALADLRGAKDTRLEACAVALVATAVLARGKPADASAALADVSAPDKSSRACKLDLETAQAMVAAAQPERRSDAITALRAVATRAATDGFVQRNLEIRLAAARLGGEDAARLARDAAQIGFKNVARRAREPR
jgi:eukaryotic-like serine/threonine-protein kinase